MITPPGVFVDLGSNTDNPIPQSVWQEIQWPKEQK